MYLHLNKNKSSHSRLSSKPSRSSRTSSSHTGSRRNHSNNSNNSNRSNSNNSSGSQILEISEQYNGTRIDKFIDEDEFELIYEPQAQYHPTDADAPSTSTHTSSLYRRQQHPPYDKANTSMLTSSSYSQSQLQSRFTDNSATYGPSHRSRISHSSKNTGTMASQSHTSQTGSGNYSGTGTGSGTGSGSGSGGNHTNHNYNEDDRYDDDDDYNDDDYTGAEENESYNNQDAMTLSTRGTRTSFLTRQTDFTKQTQSTGRRSRRNLFLTRSRRNISSRKATAESVSEGSPNDYSGSGGSRSGSRSGSRIGGTGSRSAYNDEEEDYDQRTDADGTYNDDVGTLDESRMSYRSQQSKSTFRTQQSQSTFHTRSTYTGDNYNGTNASMGMGSVGSRSGSLQQGSVGVSVGVGEEDYSQLDSYQESELSQNDDFTYNDDVSNHDNGNDYDDENDLENEEPNENRNPNDPTSILKNNKHNSLLSQQKQPLKSALKKPKILRGMFGKKKSKVLLQSAANAIGPKKPAIKNASSHNVMIERRGINTSGNVKKGKVSLFGKSRI